MQVYTRTCQECGHEIKAEPPNMSKPLTKAFEYKKCPKCKSEAFDLGSYSYVEPLTDRERSYLESLEEPIE